MTATDIAAALAPRKRNNRGRKAATVAVTLAKTEVVPTALEAMRILLQDTQASLLEQRGNPPDMSPAPENIAGRAAVIEHTRKLANIEERIQSMQRKIATMEEQDAQNPTTTDAPHQPIKGLSTLQGLFAKALGGTPHKIT
jgi:TolA-binding protein